VKILGECAVAHLHHDIQRPHGFQYAARPAGPAQIAAAGSLSAAKASALCENLRTPCGVNMARIKLILDLMNEAERLRARIRFSA